MSSCLGQREVASGPALSYAGFMPRFRASSRPEGASADASWTIQVESTLTAHATLHAPTIAAFLGHAHITTTAITTTAIDAHALELVTRM